MKFFEQLPLPRYNNFSERIVKTVQFYGQSLNTSEKNIECNYVRVLMWPSLVDCLY